MLSEQEALERLREGQVQILPLSLELLQAQPPGEAGRRLDAIVRVRWRNRVYDFGVEYRSRSTPKEFQTALNQVLNANRSKSIYPMVMMPYLSERQLRELEDRGVSGIDLCGNGVVIVPGELLVLRTGAPNRFPQSAPIKNVYRKNSSIVARVFLLRPEFPSVNEIQVEIVRRNGDVSLSTVSKVLKVMEDDLIVGRDSGAIRLLQPDKLLDKLVANYQRPDIKRFFHGKVLYDQDVLMRNLLDNSQRRQLPLIVSGVGSTSMYAVMARDEMLSVYCPQPYTLLAGIPVEETTRFPNLEVLETHDPTVYFDARFQYPYPWASPIQTYLELIAGEKRFRQTAEQVREVILREIARQKA